MPLHAVCSYDCLIFVKKDKYHTVLDDMNSFDPQLKFTFENMENNSLRGIYTQNSLDFRFYTEQHIFVSQFQNIRIVVFCFKRYFFRAQAENDPHRDHNFTIFREIFERKKLR